MFRTRNFYLMKIYTITGKYLGVVNDILIDFSEGIVTGFFIGGFKIFKKNRYISSKNIISIEDVIIISKADIEDGIKFNTIKHMDIIDNKNLMKGVVEDLIIDKDDLSIRGIIISSGVFDTMFKGKDILLIGDCVLCEEFILYKGEDKIGFKILPHSLGGKNSEIHK